MVPPVAFVLLERPVMTPQRIGLFGVISVVLALVIASPLLTAPSPAAAAEASSTVATYTPPTRSASPGVGYAYGVPLAQMTTCYAADTGGWYMGGEANATFNSAAPSTAAAAGRYARPVEVILSDPCVTGTAPNFNVRTTAFWTHVADTSPDAVTSAYCVGVCAGTPATPVNVITCAATEWSLPAARQTLSFSAGNANAGGTTGVTTLTGSAVTQLGSGSSTCKYLISAVVTYQWWGGSAQSPASNYARATWSAERFWLQTDYRDWDTAAILCGIQWSADCVYFTPEDPTSFESVCRGAPVPAWLDFSWLPRFVGHYAQCLFVPSQGLDGAAIEESLTHWYGYTLVTQDIPDLTDAINVTETCGVVLNNPGSSVLGPFSVDTCSWDWVDGGGWDMKGLLTGLVWIGGGSFFLYLLYRVGIWTLGSFGLNDPSDEVSK